MTGTVEDYGSKLSRELIEDRHDKVEVRTVVAVKQHNRLSSALFDIMQLDAAALDEFTYRWKAFRLQLSHPHRRQTGADQPCNHDDNEANLKGELGVKRMNGSFLPKSWLRALQANVSPYILDQWLIFVTREGAIGWQS